jgi:hypothetical protein
MTRTEITTLLAYLAEAYPNTRLPATPKDRIDVWHTALVDEPADAIFAAARIAVKGDEFHPSPARLISVMVTGSTATGQIPRVRVQRYLEGRGSRALGSAS